MDYQQLAFEHAPAAIVVLSQRRMMAMNQAFEQLFGYSKQELLEQSIAKLFPSLEDYEKIGHDALQGLLEQRSLGYSDQRFMQHQNGQLFWTQTYGHTLTPEDPFRLAVWHFERKDQLMPKLQLSKRETEITQYIVNGLTCKEIAKLLGLSHRTVEVHKANLMKKLGVRNKNQLSSKIITTITAKPISI
jgi:PAS domain S-box-containing protein